MEFDSAKIGKSWILRATCVKFRNDPRACTVRAGYNQDGVHALLDLAVTCTDHGRNTPCELRASATGVDVRGDLTLRGDCRLTDGEIAPRIVITTQDATVILPRCRTRLDGLTGSLSLADSLDVRTPENQYLFVRRLTYGTPRLNQGSMKLHIASDPAVILVEHTEWELRGARVRSEALCIDRNTGTITGTVFIDDLSLGKALSLCLGGHVAAEGMLHGQLTFGRAPGLQRALHLENAVLAARPGGGCWTISTPSAQAAIESSAETLQTRPRHSRNRKRYSELVTSLLDFEYDTLQIDLIPEVEGLMVRVTTSGRARATQVPMEFKRVVVEIPGANPELPDVLAWQ